MFPEKQKVWLQRPLFVTQVPPRTCREEPWSLSFCFCAEGRRGVRLPHREGRSQRKHHDTADSSEWRSRWRTWQSWHHGMPLVGWSSPLHSLNPGQTGRFPHNLELLAGSAGGSRLGGRGGGGGRHPSVSGGAGPSQSLTGTDPTGVERQPSPTSPEICILDSTGEGASVAQSR